MSICAKLSYATSRDASSLMWGQSVEPSAMVMHLVSRFSKADSPLGSQAQDVTSDLLNESIERSRHSELELCNSASNPTEQLHLAPTLCHIKSLASHVHVSEFADPSAIYKDIL